jgi:sarcosine oxidase subunit alpha
MTLEGAKVEAAFELLPYSSGLPRNIQQCLVDYGIPLYLNTTVVDIVGRERLEGVWAAQVDGARRPVGGTERFIACDTLLLSVGLIPENELAREAGLELNAATGGPSVDDVCMTNIPGIFSCGNALQVHDLADWVSEEARRAGTAAAKYAVRGDGGKSAASAHYLKVSAGGGVRYVVPDRICLGGSGRGTQDDENEIVLSFRVLSPSRGGVVEVWSKTETKKILLKKAFHARLHPAEMVRVKLDGADMEKIAGMAAALEVSAS